MLIALYSPVMASGKSAVASTLCASRGYHLIKFAQPAKDIVKGILMQGGATSALAERMIEGDLKEEIIPSLGVSTRSMLQTLGTDWGRNKVSPDLWVEIAKQRIKEATAAGWDVVIDDMRFGNEYEAVLELGGVPVKVIRAGTRPYRAHASEGLLDSYPMHHLQNFGTLDQLRACAEQLPELLAARH